VHRRGVSHSGMQSLFDKIILFPTDLWFWVCGLLPMLLMVVPVLMVVFLCLRKWGLHRSETIAALLLSGIVLFFQLSFLVSAGGLWRDEANSVHLATVPTFSELWQNLDGDSFPLLWLLVLRCWALLGLTQSDLGVRMLGFCIALGVFAALWLNARWIGYRLP